MRFDRPALARTRRGDAPLRLAVAADPWSRLRGLMFRTPLRPTPDGTPGLLLVGCASVHGAFVREALDIVFLCERGRVVSAARLPRWGAAWAVAPREGAPARHTLELPRGSLARLGLLAGDWVLPADAAPVAVDVAVEADPFAATGHPGVSRWARA